MKTQLLLILLVVAIRAAAQDIPSIVTDRPDQTESSVCVPKGYLQVETGISYEIDKGSDTEYSVLAPGSTLMRLGLLDGFEMRFVMEYNRESLKLPGAENPSISEGWLPIELGYKVFITEQKRLIPEMAIIGHFALPGTGADIYTEDYLLPSTIISVSYELPAGLCTGINVGGAWQAQAAPTGFYSWVVGAGVSERLSAFVETYGYYGSEQLPDFRVDGGFTWLLTNELQLDVSGGAGVSDISPDYFVSGGISFRLPLVKQ